MVCPYSLSRPGGVQGQVLGISRALREMGHEAVVMAPAEGRVEGPEAAGAETVVLGRSLPLPANGSVAPVTLGPLASARALRALRSGGFDVVHLHEPLAPGPGTALMLRAREPVVATFHRSGASASYRLMGVAARHALGRLAVRCAVSPEAAATASAVAGGHYEIVGNGVRTDRFSSATPWPTDNPTVLFVGRHEARKGLAVLLEAWETLARGDCTLWVAGEGPESDALRRRHPARPGLEWLGRIDDDELAERLAGAHLLCAPATGGESFGVVLVEAMAARTAVVASDIPGYSFVVGAHGALVPPGDARALARALGDSLSDAARGTGTCSPAALEAARAHAAAWDMKNVAGRYLSLYESACERARARRLGARPGGARRTGT
jgi:phosphatidylinositol alpha-mannosyltransferase